jgi:hypothetical protein
LIETAEIFSLQIAIFCPSGGLSTQTMATLLPPPSKRAKLLQPAQEPIDLSTVTGNVLCQFKASDTGETTGTTIRIPARTSAKELELLLNQLLNNVLQLQTPTNLCV